MRAAAVALLAALPICPAAAGDPSGEAGDAPAAAYGAAHPDCRAWSDACIVCQKQDGEDPACSTAGIACAPAAPKCLEPPEAAPQGQ